MNWPHIHLALNHVPVLGTFFVLALFAVGRWRKNEDITRLALWWFVALSLASILIKFTGDFAHEALEGRAWMDPAVVTAHEQSADQATTGVFFLGLAAAFTLFRAHVRKRPPSWAHILVAVLAAATAFLMVRSAFLGGKIRHDEIHAPSNQTGEEY